MTIEQNLIRISKPDAPVYRYFRAQWLMETFRTNNLILRDPRTWDDQFENFLSVSKARLKSTNEIVSLHGVFDRIFGLSWTWIDSDSDEAWRIFSPCADGIRVKSTPRKLLQAIYDTGDPFAELSYFVGEVHYCDESDFLMYLNSGTNSNAIALDSTGISHVQVLLLKRLPFVHESEVRMLCFDHGRRRSCDANCFFCINPSDLFDEIVFDPRTDLDDYRKMEKELRQLNFTKTIYRSGLYSFAPLELELDV